MNIIVTIMSYMAFTTDSALVTHFYHLAKFTERIFVHKEPFQFHRIINSFFCKPETVISWCNEHVICELGQESQDILYVMIFTA